MKKIFAVFLLVLCSLTFSNCKKKEQQPDLPPITTTGENTFGCYIDGEPYAISEGTPNPWKLTWTKFDDHANDGMLYILVSHENPRWTFDIKIKNSNRVIGTFESKNYPFKSRFFDFYTNLDHFLTVEIIKAIPNRHYAGTFSGEMINGEGKVIQITDGRFDIKK